MTPETWTGCYDDGWRDVIVPAAFAHPAKAARGLLVRIFDELFAMGAIQKGDVILDPFAGIGTTGIEAASRGCRFIGVEVEEKFVALARENFARHAATWAAMGRPQPVVVRGDSRRLREAIGPVLADTVVGSPPFQECLSDKPSKSITKSGLRMGASSMGDGYGTTPGQLGAM